MRSGRSDRRKRALAVLIVCYYNKSSMKIIFDAAKRDKNVKEKGLDFLRAGEVFEGATVTEHDARKEYGEARFVTVGRLDGRIVVVVWTPRGLSRRIISMRKANEREIKKYTAALD